MTSTDTSPGPLSEGAAGDDVVRLTADERRERLLDEAKDLLILDGAHSVTMGSVADAAGVTRALVYKHFDNKHDLLLALYRREARRLDRMMSNVVLDAGPGFEDKLRVLIDLLVDAADEYGTFFGLLRSVSDDAPARADRRSWDRRTVRYFAGLAAEEYGLDERTANAGVAGVMPGLLNVRSRVIANPAEREFFTETFLRVATNGLRALAEPAER